MEGGVRSRGGFLLRDERLDSFSYTEREGQRRKERVQSALGSQFVNVRIIYTNSPPRTACIYTLPRAHLHASLGTPRRPFAYFETLDTNVESGVSDSEPTLIPSALHVITYRESARVFRECRCELVEVVLRLITLYSLVLYLISDYSTLRKKDWFRTDLLI